VKTSIEDTYAEAFEGLFCRLIVTADDAEVLERSAHDATATPSIVIGRVEGGIEKWLRPPETPDRRLGAILQFWGGLSSKTPLRASLQRFETELSYRLRQDILVKPFTAVFNATQISLGTIDMMNSVGHCGDGYEWEERRYDRSLIVIPLMVPDFLIERYLGYAKGVMGANFWYMCRDRQSVSIAGQKALKAIDGVEGVITPFGICSAGSKPETRFPHIGPTTNHPYCPSLTTTLGMKSKVPQGVQYIPEIVINGTSLDAVKKAMKAGIEAVGNVAGVKAISAGNYGGKLGKYKISLREIL
jgi:formylmethanofuran--tetrahydromethanopterin N-formyltransferase